MALSIPDTAFIIAYYRANNELVSCDPYAKLWVRPSLQKWVNEFATKVSEYDELLHCMRNRYFHLTLEELLGSGSKLLCINLGAGFSMYPYNLSEDLVTIEADFDDVVAFKKEAIARFTADGSLPSRKVRWINTDITRQEDQARLKTLLNDYKGYRKVIMIEGVFFFLNQGQINSVIEFCREILNTGDILLAESFEEQIKETAVFIRLKTYFEKELHSDGTTTTLPRSFYEELPGFNLKRSNSTLELARELELVPEDMQESEVLNEYCYFLVRE
ncbi:MAG: hypothetical protein DWP94_09845 [Flavobacterium sp.]|nr:MAG: hypothetical protein DWP94_09845 [Flavobacterium sp.]